MSDQRLIRIEDKIDRIQAHMSSIDVTLAAQHVSLDEHIKRTNLLEQEIKPIKEHVGTLRALIRLVGILSALAGLAVTIKSLIGK